MKINISGIFPASLEGFEVSLRLQNLLKLLKRLSRFSKNFNSSIILSEYFHPKKLLNNEFFERNR